MKVIEEIQDPDRERIRLEVKHGDIIEIEPEDGELMFTVKVEEINEKTAELPHGALKLKVLPWHMDGQPHNDAAEETVEVVARG